MRLYTACLLNGLQVRLLPSPLNMTIIDKFHPETIPGGSIARITHLWPCTTREMYWLTGFGRYHGNDNIYKIEMALMTDPDYTDPDSRTCMCVRNMHYTSAIESWVVFGDGSIREVKTDWDARFALPHLKSYDRWRREFPWVNEGDHITFLGQVTGIPEKADLAPYDRWSKEKL